MKKLCLFLSLLIPLSAHTVPISEMPPRLQTFSENLGTVTATFTQTKILPEITRRFISTGRVKFIKGTGFTWQQTTPTTKTFTATTDQYCTEDGIAHPLNELPHFNYVKQTIDDMFSGDMNKFLFTFSVDYTDTPDSDLWHLTATPRFSTISDILQDITMYGSTTDLTKIIITYQNGTILIMEFAKTSQDLINDEIKC